MKKSKGSKDNEVRSYKLAALSTFTAMIVGIGASSIASAAPISSDHTAISKGISSPIEVSDIQHTVKQDITSLRARDMHIHHHNWLGGDNDVDQSGLKTPTTGIPQGRFNI